VSVERELFTGRRGDYWAQVWRRSTGASSYDASTLLVQLRTGKNERGTLVASSDPADGVALIVTESVSDPADGALVDTDFDADPAVFAWAIAAEDTAGEAFRDGADYTIEAQAEVDAVTRTFFRHAWRILPQSAVPAEVTP
jgi:hypothetical protein